MFRSLLLACVVSCPVLAGDEAPGFPPPDEGVFLYMDGKVAAAIRAEQQCAKAGIARCQSLAWQMREFVSLAANGAELDRDAVERLAAIDRNICDGQQSRTYRRVGEKVANRLCLRARGALAKDKPQEACELARAARVASPENACTDKLLAKIGERADAALEAIRKAHGEAPSAKRFDEALEEYARLACADVHTLRLELPAVNDFPPGSIERAPLH
jgi:hypothetical protein